MIKTMIKKINKIVIIIFFALVGFIVHKTVLYSLAKENEQNFIYSISLLYISFTLVSSGLILLFEKIKKKNLDYVGYSFLLITTIKMFLVYLFLRPVLMENEHNSSIEKISFFSIFIYFLAIETMLTIRIVNEK